MIRWHLNKPIYVFALAMPLVWLLVSGCRSIDQESTKRPGPAIFAQVLGTNSVPIEIEDDHVLVRGSLNGRDLRLLLDTGASHLAVTPETATFAGIRPAGNARFGGFGGDHGTGAVGVVESVMVGPATAQNVPSFIMPLPVVFEADGFLGLSFLRHFTFRLDYERKLLSFAPPGNGRLTGAGSGMSMRDDGRLTIQTLVDGIPANLVVDTGAGQGLILRSGFVEKHKLRERYPKRLKVVTGGGLLGLTYGEIARLQSLKLGDHTVNNVFVEFESTTASARDDTAGYVGAAVLRRFDLTFDVAGRRMWIEPNASYAEEPPPPATVRSGLVCLPEGTVADVIPGSPASEAGVRVGDRLLEINGLTFQFLKFGEIKRILRAEPGTQVRLRLQSDGQSSREVTLTLRDLL